MKPKYNLLLILLITAGLLLSSCAQSKTADNGHVTNEGFVHTQSGEEMVFEINVDQAYLDANSQIAIQIAGNITKGQLTFLLRDPDGNIAWENPGFGGEFTGNTFYQPKRTGVYHLGVTWEGELSGSYVLAFQAQRPSALVLVPGLGMILVAIGFVFYSRRHGGTWAYLGLGALTWFITVAVKFIFAASVSASVYQLLNVSFGPNGLGSLNNLVAYLYIGSLTGLTEILLTWLFLWRKPRLANVTWNKVLAFGIGVGAFEAILVGSISLLSNAAALIMPEAFPATSLSGILQNNNIFFGLAPVVERLAIIPCHIFSRSLLFYALLKGQPRWGWLAFAFMTLLDSVAAFAQFWGVATLDRLWLIEGCIILFGLAAVWGVVKIRAHYNYSPVEPEVVPVPAQGALP